VKTAGEARLRAVQIQRMCFSASRYVGLSTDDSRLLLILMTVIWTTNHGVPSTSPKWIGAKKNLPIGKALLRKTRRCRPAILLNWGGSQIARERNSVLRVELRTVDPKSRAKTQSRANEVDGSIGVSMIQRRPSEFTKSAYNCCSVMTCDGQANLGLRQSIRDRAHGHLGDDFFCNRCWDN
jgi:hypothetical protein